MIVSSDDYYSDISAYTISVVISVSVNCGNIHLDPWSIPALWEPVASDEIAIWAGPTYTRCSESYTNLIYEYYIIDGVQTSPLTWITEEYSTYDVIVAPSDQEFSDYADSTISIYIKAIDK